MEICMPILPVYYTTTNLRKRKKRILDRTEHDVWLAKVGLDPKSINKRYSDNDFDYKSNNAKWRAEYSASLQVERSTRHYEKSIQEVCDAAPDATAKRGVMTNIHKESEETRNAILAKAKRVMPLYNKGGLQVLSESDDLKALNKVAR
jgi:hypothetical protein